MLERRQKAKKKSNFIYMYVYFCWLPSILQKSTEIKVHMQCKIG